MNKFSLIKTLPKDANHENFSSWLNTLYDTNSLRFRLGHDPVSDHLEGCYLILHDGVPVARFAFYENPDLSYKEYKTACFGSYECIADSATARQTLCFVKEVARAKGYTYLIGPMDGSTWNSHRFTVTNPNHAFFTEPTHQDYYPQQFIDNEFSVISNYISNEDNELQVSEDFFNKKSQVEEAGIIIRNVNMAHFSEELREIAHLSNEAFKDNFLFSPIEVKSFVEKYKTLESVIDPQFINIAESIRGMEAFSFSIPDYFDKNQPTKTLILKSMARKRDAPIKGLGYILAQQTILSARESGYQRIIHAFMRSDNFSTNLSEQHADNRPLRQYELYGIAL